MSGVRTERNGDHEVFVLEDSSTGSSARVLATYGFNCFSFRCRVGSAEHELLYAADRFAEGPSNASGSGTPVLFPFPNRICAGKFEFGGKPFELPKDKRGVNAIHGLVLDRRWRVVARSDCGQAKVTGQFQLSKDAPEQVTLWPADFLIELTYSLEGNRLTSRVRVTNPDTRPLPWGFGTHPYFRLPLRPEGDASRCTVQVPAGAMWNLVEMLPTGRKLPVSGMYDLRAGRALSELKLDDAFTELQFENGWCSCRLHDASSGVEVTLRFDRLFREVVIYTPPRGGAICLEPYTCVTDAINLQARGVDAGLRVLEPGKETEGTMVLEANAVAG